VCVSVFLFFSLCKCMSLSVCLSVVCLYMSVCVSLSVCDSKCICQENRVPDSGLSLAEAQRLEGAWSTEELKEDALYLESFSMVS